MPVDLGYGLKLWTGGASPTRRGWLLFGFFSVTHFRCDSSHLQSDCTGPLAYQDHTRCSNHNRVPPSASERTPTTSKFQPCPVLSNPLLAPVELLSQPNNQLLPTTNNITGP